MTRKICFIGAGNMNGAIIKGMLSKQFKPQDILLTNPSQHKLNDFAQLGLQTGSDNIEFARQADVIVLGVKPQILPQVCKQLSQLENLTEKLFVSIAAGVTIDSICNFLGANCRVIRTMPNTPSQLGLGMTGLYAGQNSTEQDKAITESVMSSVGEFVWVENETQIDAVTAIAGSGPAYFYLFMEAMQQQAEAFGFNPEQSRTLVQQTALGAASLVQNAQDTEISELRRQVTSKGGTTAAAIEYFQDNQLSSLVADAMQAAMARAQQLAQSS